MSQTTYSVKMPVAFPGLIADAATPPDVLSRANEETSNVAFGLAVRGGTDSFNQFKLPSTTGQVILGVLAHRHNREDVAASGLDTGEVGDIVKRGRVWVVTDEQITLGDPVYVRHTGPGTLGAFRNDADTAKADQLTSARWVAVASATLAQLDISLP